MHILMLTDAMDIGGAETHILTLTEALLRRGHRVHVLSCGGCYEDALRAAGATCEHWPANKRTPAAILRCALRLMRLVRRERFDILHAHTRMSATLSCMLVRHTPTVSTAHLPFPADGLRRRLMRWGEHTLAVSEDIQAYLTETYGIKKEATTVTRNGMDTQSYAPTSAEGEDVVHISRLDRDRSMCAHLLCRIAPRLLKGSSRHIHIVGDGTEADDIREQANEANLALGYEAVIVHGKATDVRPILQTAAVFVGVSRAALEAMSMQRCVLLCGNEGYGGILDEASFAQEAATNFCARGREVATEQALLRDLASLLADPSQQRSLGVFLRRMVVERFSAERMAEDALGVYRRVLCPRSACIIGYYGYGNLGDEATLSVLKRGLMKRNIYNIRIFSRYDSEDGSQIGRLHVKKIARMIRESDVVLFGGGNLLQNETSRRSLLLYRLLLRYAAHYHKRIVMVSVGLGELYGRRAELAAGRALRRADGIFVRTTADGDHTKALLGKHTGVHVGYAHDACFSLWEHSGGPSKRRVIFILRGAQRSSALMAFAVTVDTLRRRGYSVALLVLFGEQDASFCYQLAKHFSMPLLCADSYTAFTEHANGASFIVSERLHGAIFSLLCHTPCFLLDGPVKNHRLIEEVGRTSQHLDRPSPLYAYASMEELCRRVDQRTRPFIGHPVSGRHLRGRITRPHGACAVCRKKEIGGTEASDFTNLLRSLRGGDSWESFVFYEDM